MRSHAIKNQRSNNKTSVDRYTLWTSLCYSLGLPIKETTYETMELILKSLESSADYFHRNLVLMKPEKSHLQKFVREREIAARYLRWIIFYLRKQRKQFEILNHILNNHTVYIAYNSKQLGRRNIINFYNATWYIFLRNQFKRLSQSYDRLKLLSIDNNSIPEFKQDNKIYLDNKQANRAAFLCGLLGYPLILTNQYWSLNIEELMKLRLNMLRKIHTDKNSCYQSIDDKYKNKYFNMLKSLTNNYDGVDAESEFPSTINIINQLKKLGNFVYLKNTELVTNVFNEARDCHKFIIEALPQLQKIASDTNERIQQLENENKAEAEKLHKEHLEREKQIRAEYTKAELKMTENKCTSVVLYTGTTSKQFKHFKFFSHGRESQSLVSNADPCQKVFCIEP